MGIIGFWDEGGGDGLSFFLMRVNGDWDWLSIFGMSGDLFSVSVEADWDDGGMVMMGLV